MKALDIRLVVATASLALIGLVSIQVYWIRNSIATERDKLNRVAVESINEVAELLEKHETLTKLKSHQEAKYLFIQDAAETEPAFPPDDSLVQYVLQKNIENKDGMLEMRIKEQSGESSKESVISYSEDAIPYTLDLERDFELKIIEPDSQMPMSVSSNEPVADQIDALRERLVTKRAFLGDIVKSLIEVNLNERIDERVDPKVLDSLISAVLEKHGISLEYDFGVYQKDGEFMFGNADHPDQLSQAKTTARLFPNDVIQQPYFLHLSFPDATGYLLRNLWLLLSISLLFLIAISTTSYYTVRTIIQQKKNSEIKNDFINNMTHELKTPISTISLACEALNDPELSQIENIKNRYIGIINTENKRLGLLVEEVLQSAVLDRGDFKLKIDDVDFHDLLTDVIDKFQIQVKERGGSISLVQEASVSIVEGDKNHLVNVVYNLLDNAAKYSKDQPEIEVKTSNREGQFIVSVSDKGIGIKPENLKKVFDKLYRVPTGNLHNVKGFGLGLSYVKIITERHGGRVYAQSKSGQGSTFTIEIPLKPMIANGNKQN